MNKNHDTGSAPQPLATVDTGGLVRRFADRFGHKAHDARDEHPLAQQDLRQPDLTQQDLTQERLEANRV